LRIIRQRVADTRKATAGGNGDAEEVR